MPKSRINVVEKSHHRADMIIFLAVFFLHNTCQALDVRVSQTSGNDTLACLEPNSTVYCKTVQFALQGLDNRPNETALRVTVMDHTYLISERIKITQPNGKKSIVITSARGSVFQCTSVTAGVDVGSKIWRQAQNIQFSNLVFQHCGPIKAATILIWRAINITFRNCEFRDNFQPAINSFDSSGLIEGCLFVNNTFNQNAASEHFRPGLVSMSGAVGYFVADSSNLLITIKDSRFYYNSAVVHNDEFFVTAASNISDFNEGGGAILIAITHNSQGCKVNLHNLTVKSNSATYGGGIYLATSGMSTGNTFVLSNSFITGNRAGQAGGGICISQWDFTRNTSFLLKNCTINNNWSCRGAGVNGFFMSFTGTVKTSLEMHNLHVHGNMADSSPGFRFTSSLPFGNGPATRPVFINCTISGHVSSPRNIHTYLAPITAQRISVLFSGYNFIQHNRGIGGMDIENGVLYVQGKLSFTNNTGHTGGALRLWSSQIKLYPGSELVFSDNHATNIGGAMAVQLFPTYEVIHEYNVDCFLTYSESLTPPSKWKTNITFIRNSAKLKGAAIFVSSLASCLWDEEYPYYNITRSLRWLDNKFIYRDNYLLPTNSGTRLIGTKYDIATDTERLDTGSQPVKSIKLSPGENMNIHLRGEDELGHAVYTIASLSEIERNGRHADLMLDNPMHVLSPLTNNTLPLSYHVRDKATYLAIVNKTHEISIMGTYSSKNVDYLIEVESVACWPGYAFEESTCTCICNKNITGVLRCSGGRIVYLDKGYWGGVYKGTLFTYFCPYKYCACVKATDGLPGCRLDPNDINEQCALGREGTLCGRCKKGLSVGLQWNDCLECSGAGWILIIVFIVVVGFCIIVIWLNPGMSKDLRGPLFFFQMLPFIFAPNDSVGQVVVVISYLLQFGGPIVYFWKTCITKGINNLYSVAVGYMMPVTTLLIFLVAYILSSKGVIRMKLRKTSRLQAFWVLILFMYKYLVETTMRLLHCQIVERKMVFFYDGNVECFHGDHLFMAILAIFVLFILVIPPPVIIVLLTLGYWKVDPQYFSTLTEGLQPHCLWWWAVDLGRRIVLVGVYVFIPHWRTKQLWMIFVSVLVFGVHSNVQPYKRSRTNLTESLYLLVLCTLTIVQIVETDDLKRDISGFLLAIAAIHTSFLCLYKSWQFFRKRCQCTCSRLSQQRSYESLNESEHVGESNVDPELNARQALFDTIFASSETEDNGTTHGNSNK